MPEGMEKPEEMERPDDGQRLNEELGAEFRIVNGGNYFTGVNVSGTYISDETSL